MSQPKLPNGLTYKQEAFAQGVASGLNQSDAYRQAYNAENMVSETIWQRASEVAEHSRVKVRIAELQAETQAQVAQKRAWDLERLINESEVNLQGARRAEQWAPANNALQFIGKAAGIVKDQPQAPQNVHNTIIQLAADATIEELLRLRDAATDSGAGGTLELPEGVIEGESKSS